MRIFGKIRFDVIGKEQASRYLRYAVGEIVLVVLGILIALQINNWNESRKQSAREEEFIAGVRNDLKQDRDYIQLVIGLAEPRLEAYRKLGQELSGPNSTDEAVLLSLFKNYFVSQRTFYPISGSFQSAISGNEINNYQDKYVTHTIIKLYNSTYSRLLDNAENLDQRWNYLSKKYSHERRTGKLREMNPDQVSELLDDIYYHYIQLEWYSDMLTNTLVEIDALLHEKDQQ